MGVTINGKSTTYNSPPLVGTQSTGGASATGGTSATGGASVVGQTVHTTTGGGSTPPPEEDVPLVGDGASESPPPAEGDVPSPKTASEIPDPETDPAAYANYLQQQLDLQEQYAEWDAQLAELQAQGDPQAAKLRSELLKKMWSGRDIEKAQEFVDDHADMLDDADLDGDGIDNARDVDKDGDMLTAEAEALMGTSDLLTDTDGDMITDYGEAVISKKDSEFGWLDPTNPDADHNGELDGNQLPSSITFDQNGKSLTTNGGGSPDGTPGTGGVGSTSTSVRWSPASSDAQQAAWGGTYEGGTDVVFEGKGENVSFSKSGDGKDLIITNKDTGETITAKNYQSTKIYLKGTFGTTETENIGSGIFGGVDKTGDGYADAGIDASKSNIEISSIKTNSDFFGGAVPKIDGAEGEITYDGDGSSGVFTSPESVNGNVYEVKTEGNDVIITVKDSRDGEPTSTIRVKNGKAAFENGDLSFDFGDVGHAIYFDSGDLKVTVHGGKGNDVIIGAAGSQIYGGAGHDDLRMKDGTATGGVLHGEAGDDMLQGGTATETLDGGEGNDGMFTGVSIGDTLNGGGGDDVGIVDNTSAEAEYNVNMGSGIDMSNYTNKDSIDANTNSSIEVGMYELGGIQGAIDNLGDSASSDVMKEAIKNAGGIAELGADMAADAVKTAFLGYMARRGNDNKNAFNSDGTSSPDGFDPSGGDVPPPVEEEEKDKA